MSAHIGYLFQHLPLAARFAAASEAGFDAIELPDPYGLSLRRFRTLCEESGLEVAQIALPNGPEGASKKGLAAYPELRAEFRDALKLSIQFATAVNCRSIHPMAGTGVPRQASPEWNSYLSNLDYACSQAADAGLQVIIEAISARGVANYFINSLDWACTAIEQVAAPNLYLLLDTYHASAMNIDIASFIVEHGSKVGHVQIADWPERHEPGSGQTDFGAIFEALRQSRYEGFVGLEYHAAIDGAGAFDWVRTLDKYLEPLR